MFVTNSEVSRQRVQHPHALNPFFFFYNPFPHPKSEGGFRVVRNAILHYLNIKQIAVWTNNLRHVQKWSREPEDPLLYIRALEVWDEPPDPSSSFQVNGPCARPTK